MDAASLIAALDAGAPETLERNGVSALAVGVLSHGEQVERAFGVSPDTTFRIASVTKPLVAALALRLVEEGRLALDGPLTGLRLPWDGITLRHLLSHQAGLAGDWPRSLEEYGDGDDALQRLADEEALAGPVGPAQFFSYSNLGFWLVGAAIEQASAEGFEAALQGGLLEPLGMERTAFVPVEPFLPSAQPYPRARRPSGGLYSCVGDVLRFAAHLLGGPGPLSAELLQEMQTPQIALDPGGDSGLGIFLWQGRGLETVEHGGSVPGFRSHLVLVPAEDTALVLLAAGEHGRLVTDELLETAGLGLELPPETSVAEEQLARYAAGYRDPLGGEIVVTARDGGLDLTSDDPAFAVHLRPATPEWFLLREGEHRGDSADFLRDGQLLRFGWLYERLAE